MEPRIAKIDQEIHCAGYLLKTNMADIGADNPIPGFWGDIFKDGRHTALQALKGRCKADYGICIMLNDDDMDYVIAAVLEEGTQVPEEMHQCEIPAGDYLVYETLLPNLGQVWSDSFQWMEKNGYTVAHGISFEFYDMRMADPDPNKQFIDIYIPIKSKK